MVSSIINFDQKANRIINKIKAEYDLDNKNQAVNLVVKKLGIILLEPELRSEYLKKLKKIEKKIVSREQFEKELKVRI